MCVCVCVCVCVRVCVRVCVLHPLQATKANDTLNSFINSLTEDDENSQDGEGGGIFKMLWGLLVTAMVLGFIKSAMENFAQQYLREKIDAASKAKRR